METLATIITGFSIFVLGQIFLRLVIDPIYQLKKTIANASNTFVCCAHALHNAGKISPELNDGIFKKLRNLSGQLYEDLALMPKRHYKNKYLRKFFFYRMKIRFMKERKT